MKIRMEDSHMKSSALTKSAVLLLALASSSSVATMAQSGGAVNSGPFASNSVGGFSSNAIGSFGSSSPLRPLKPFYPRAQVQNPSNPWLPPNLSQVNTTLLPVGSVSPTGTLAQPTSVLNSPNTVQQAGFPTVPSYNIGTATPTTQSVTVSTASTSPLIANPSNPSGQGTSSITQNGSVSRTNPTNPLFP
jgi:hypothetical protein